MKPVRVRLALRGGLGPEIDAYPTPVPGLVIHRTFGQPDDVYTVTQQHSGIAAVGRLPSPEAALGCAMDLGELADWTQPVDLRAILQRGILIATRWGAGPVITATDSEARAAGAIR